MDDKTRRFAAYSKIEVEWEDSSAKGRWDSIEDYRNATARALTVRSVGYPIRNDARGIVLVQSAAANGDVCDSITIPRGCVKSVRRLSGGLKK